jgi:hypothetical protein
MGNGQCPECYGVHPGWLGHPLFQTSGSIGHEAGCPIASSIKEIGGDPIMIGSYHGPVKLSDHVISLNKYFTESFERHLMAELGALA